MHAGEAPLYGTPSISSSAGTCSSCVGTLRKPGVAEIDHQIRRVVREPLEQRCRGRPETRTRSRGATRRPRASRGASRSPPRCSGGRAWSDRAGAGRRSARRFAGDRPWPAPVTQWHARAATRAKPHVHSACADGRKRRRARADPFCRRGSGPALPRSLRAIRTLCSRGRIASGPSSTSELSARRRTGGVRLDGTGTCARAAVTSVCSRPSTTASAECAGLDAMRGADSSLKHDS